MAQAAVSPARHEAKQVFAHANPNHHLWNNNGTWWLHCTVHLPNFTKERLRRSLGTANVDEARARRDRILAELARRTDLQLSVRHAVRQAA